MAALGAWTVLLIHGGDVRFNPLLRRAIIRFGTHRVASAVSP